MLNLWYSIEPYAVVAALLAGVALISVDAYRRYGK